MKLRSMEAWRRLFSYYSFLLIAWGFFRLCFRFPEAVEEALFKPVVWLLPLFWLWFKDKDRLSFFEGNSVRAVLFGLGLGMIYMVVAAVAGGSKVVEGDWFWSDIVGLGLVTAISEEIVFSGFLFMKMWKLSEKLWTSMMATSVMTALLHIPVAVFVLNYTLVQLIWYLSLVVLVSMGNAWVMSRTKNVVAPILSHWLWGVAVYAFR